MADDLRPLAYQHYMSAIGFALPNGAHISPRRIAIVGGMDGVGAYAPCPWALPRPPVTISLTDCRSVATNRRMTMR